MNYKDIINTLITDYKDTLEINGEIKYTIEKTYNRELSNVAKVILYNSQYSKSVYIKVSPDLHRVMWGSYIENENQILQSIRKSQTLISTNVPKIIAYFPEEHTLITEEVPGVDLTDKLVESMSYQSLFSAKNCDKAIVNTGEWLREFHQFTSIRQEYFDLEPALIWIERRLRVLIDHNAPGADENFYHNILNYLHSLKNEIDKGPVLISGSHADFCPHNVLVDDSLRVTVIDFASYSRGPVLYDVIRFCNELDNLGYQFRNSSKKSNNLKRVFLESYGNDIDWSSPLVKFITCQFKVAKLLAAYYSKLGYIKFWSNGQIPYYKNLSYLKKALKNE